MPLPTFSIIDLSGFTGRSIDSFDPVFSVEALEQAMDLFLEGTCLSDDDFPAVGTREYRTARRGVLAMADAIGLSQEYQEIKANPFSSETIGSYSYSKVSTAIQQGLPTGVSWFDLATSKLSKCGLFNGFEGATHGGIEVFERNVPGYPYSHDQANTQYIPPYEEQPYNGYRG